MQIEVTGDALKNLRYAARQTGRPPEELAADAVSAAFAPYADARKAERREAVLAIVDGAADTDTISALRARLAAAEKSAE